VATKNKTFKMVVIDQLTRVALDSVTHHNWKKCVIGALQINTIKNTFRETMCWSQSFRLYYLTIESPVTMKTIWKNNIKVRNYIRIYLYYNITFY